MIRNIFCCLFLCAAVALAKKGGKAPKVSSEGILNPDPDAANADTSVEYNGDLTEGDIASKDGKKNGEDRNAVSDVNKLWPQAEVPYEFHRTLSGHMQGKVKEAMADYHKYTCIRWVKRRGQKDYVNINSMKGGCYAYKGRSGGEQPLNLQDPGCDVKGIIIHEMLHTIGFAHEQSRVDRDQYITINWNAIQSGKASQFEKQTQREENNLNQGYDFKSVMHYGPTSFARRRNDITIKTKNPSHQDEIGQRYGFSEQDVKEVNLLYKCNGSRSGIKGRNGCMDKDGHQCEDVMKQYGKDRACNSRGNIPQFCAYSCGKCN